MTAYRRLSVFLPLDFSTPFTLLHQSIQQTIIELQLSQNLDPSLDIYTTLALPMTLGDDLVIIDLIYIILKTGTVPTTRDG